jgi:Lon protease-like protein
MTPSRLHSSRRVTVRTWAKAEQFNRLAASFFAMANFAMVSGETRRAAALLRSARMASGKAFNLESDILDELTPSNRTRNRLVL